MTMATVIRDLQAERTRLATELSQVDRALATLGTRTKGRAPGRKSGARRISRAGKARIAAAARKRWAAWRREQRKAGK